MSEVRERLNSQGFVVSLSAQRVQGCVDWKLGEQGYASVWGLGSWAIKQVLRFQNTKRPDTSKCVLVEHPGVYVSQGHYTHHKGAST